MNKAEYHTCSLSAHDALPLILTRICSSSPSISAAWGYDTRPLGMPMVQVEDPSYRIRGGAAEGRSVAGAPSSAHDDKEGLRTASFFSVVRGIDAATKLRGGGGEEERDGRSLSAAPGGRALLARAFARGGRRVWDDHRGLSGLSTGEAPYGRTNEAGKGGHEHS